METFCEFFSCLLQVDAVRHSAHSADSISAIAYVCTIHAIAVVVVTLAPLLWSKQGVLLALELLAEEFFLCVVHIRISQTFQGHAASIVHW